MYNVTVTITSDSIRISDDGLGMTEDTIRNSWAVVATPNKEKNPIVV
jgi:HSP90 family molecular chaperone